MSKYDSIIGSIVKADVDVYPLPVYRYLETLLVILYPRYYGVNWSYTLVHINTQLFAFRGKYDVSYKKFALNETFGSSSNIIIVFVNEILKMVDLSGYIMLLAEEQGVPKLFGMLTSY